MGVGEAKPKRLMSDTDPDTDRGIRPEQARLGSVLFLSVMLWFVTQVGLGQGADRAITPLAKVDDTPPATALYQSYRSESSCTLST